MIHRIQICIIICVALTELPISKSYAGTIAINNLNYAYQQTQKENGYTWSYFIYNDEARITGSYNSWYFAGISPLPTGTAAVTIPSNLGGVRVSEIGYYAFYNCSDMRGVLIPDSVMNIGDHAFYKCSSLPEIKIPNSVTNIADYAFSDCSGLINIKISTNLVNIGVRAFSGCTGLLNAEIPEKVSSIGPSSFCDCTRLSSVTIKGNDNSSIGEYAFYNTALTNVTICNGVSSIGNHSFADLVRLKNIVIPPSVRSIGQYAFAGCSGLTNVIISTGVIDIENHAFANCIRLKEVIIPESVSRIGNNAFQDCTGLTSVKICNNETTFGDYSFNGCNQLQTIYIPLNYKGDTTKLPPNVRIERCKFQQLVTLDCGYGTTDVRIVQHGEPYGPLPKPSRSGYTFMGWEYKSNFVTPDTIVSALNDHVLVARWKANQYNVIFDANGGKGGINAYLDYGTEIIVPTVTREGYFFNGWTPSVDTTVPARDVRYVAQWRQAYYKVTFDVNDGETAPTTIIKSYGSSLGELPIPIRPGCIFNGWWTADLEGDQITTETVITSNVTYYAHWIVIESIVFTINESGTLTDVSLNGATSVEIPFGVTRIAAGVFAGNDNLECISIPSSVETIGTRTFYGCTRLKHVIIADGVKYIDPAAFSGCCNLSNVKIPDSIVDIASDAFDETPFYDNYPDGLVVLGRVAYKIKGEPPSLITIPDGVKTISAAVFQNCDKLIQTTIPNSVVNIYSSAFSCCYALKSVALGENIEFIGNTAFQYCYELDDLVLPRSVKSIGWGAFMYCSSLKKIIIPSGVKQIEEETFSYCENLRDITIPSSVTSIKSRAFYYCSSLTNVMLKGDCPTIGASAFSKVSASCIVYLPKGNTTYNITDGKWQGMKVQYYDPVDLGVSIQAHGKRVEFVTEEDRKTRTSTVPQGTTSNDIKVFSDGVDVTKGFSIKIEGVKATVSLLPPYMIERNIEGTVEPWTKNADGQSITLNIEIVPGLYYAAVSSTSIDELKCPGSSLPAKIGDTLIVPMLNESQGFYKVWVSDAPLKKETK